MKVRVGSAVVLSALLIAVLCSGTVSTGAEPQADPQAIRAAVEQYFQAMRARDADGVRNLLSSSLTAVEAGKNARVEVINTENAGSLLPPEGNKDWEKITVSDISVSISSTHPSVATVTFGLMMKLGDDEKQGMERMLAAKDVPITEEERKRAEKVIKDGGFRSEMFALMAREGGKWKIVAMTMPQ